MYKKGESGNLTGRPKGIKDKRAELRALLDPHARDIIHKLVNMALEGDIGAIKLCVERLIPKINDKIEINSVTQNLNVELSKEELKEVDKKLLEFVGAANDQ